MASPITTQLVELRKKSRLRQADAAEKAQITRVSLSRFERGVGSCTVEVLEKLLDIYGYHIEIHPNPAPKQPYLAAQDSKKL